MSKAVAVRKFTDLVIPFQIYLDEDLSPLEKLVWGEIRALDGSDGCYAKNEHFAKFFGITDRRVKQIFARLLSKKLILKFFDEKSFRILKINYAALDSVPKNSLLWKNPEPKKVGVKNISPREINFPKGVKNISPMSRDIKRIKNPPISSAGEQAEKTKGEEEELRKFLNLWPEHRSGNPKKIAELAALLRETLEREGLTRQELFTRLKARRAIFEQWTEKHKKYLPGLEAVLSSERWKDDHFWESRVSPEVRKEERAAQIADVEHRRELEAGEVKRKIKTELQDLTAEFFEICKAGKFKPYSYDKKIGKTESGTFGEFEPRIREISGPEKFDQYLQVFGESALKLKKEAERQVA